jgi:hypothetical protein
MEEYRGIVNWLEKIGYFKKHTKGGVNRQANYIIKYFLYDNNWEFEQGNDPHSCKANSEKVQKLWDDFTYYVNDKMLY